MSRHRLICRVTLTWLIAAFTTTLFFQQLGATLVAKEADPSLIAVHPSKLRFESKLADMTVDEQGCRTQVWKLGECETNSRLELAWEIDNNTEETLRLASATSSCGCIQLPNTELELGVADRAEIPIRVRLPKEEGELKKQVAFFDRGGICRMRLELEFCVVAPVVIPEVIAIDKEGVQRVRMPIEVRTKTFPHSDFSISPDGAGILGGRFVTLNPMDSVFLELDLDTSKLGEEPRHRLDLKLVNKKTGDFDARIQRQLWIRTRAYSKPSVIRLVAEPDGWLAEFTLFVEAQDKLQRVTELNDAQIKSDSKNLSDLDVVLAVLSDECVEASHQVSIRVRIQDPRSRLKRNDLVGLTFSCLGRSVRLKCVAVAE